MSFIKNCTLPEFTCHKVVRAAEITHIELSAAGCILTVKGTESKFALNGEWWRRHRPEVGMVLVVYPGGYTSVSPKLEFDAGYSAGVNPKPRVIVVQDQGVVTDVGSDKPVDVVLLDYDTEDSDGAADLTTIPKLLYRESQPVHSRRLKEDVMPAALVDEIFASACIVPE